MCMRACLRRGETSQKKVKEAGFRMGTDRIQPEKGFVSFRWLGIIVEYSTARPVRIPGLRLSLDLEVYLLVSILN